MSVTLQLFLVAVLSAFPAMAEPAAPAAPPDKQNLSYALGMNLALEMKNSGVTVDPALVAQGLKDVLQGHPTEIAESEIPSILRQAENAGRLKLSSRNIAEGEAFLSKNATAPGVVVLPDGLQYRVLETGTGELPKRTEIVTLKFRGTRIDGTEFKHNDRLEIPLFGVPKGLQETLLKMKVGSKWQVFVPYNLTCSHPGEPASASGATLIYDLQLLSSESETAHPNQHRGAGRIGHFLDEDLLPDTYTAAMANLK